MRAGLQNVLAKRVPRGSRYARRRRRVSSASVAVCVVGAVLAPATNADLTVNGTLFSPKTVNASTRYILYYLQMHSSTASEELFSVRMTPPPIAMVGGSDHGKSIDGPTDIALQGPGTLGDIVQSPSVITPCSPRQSAFHGYATGTAPPPLLCAMTRGGAPPGSIAISS
jgi:hypothetical protein